MPAIPTASPMNPPTSACRMGQFGASRAVTWLPMMLNKARYAVASISGGSDMGRPGAGKTPMADIAMSVPMVSATPTMIPAITAPMLLAICILSNPSGSFQYDSVGTRPAPVYTGLTRRAQVKTINASNSIILDPESDSAAPVVVVYGGLMGWEGAWLIPRLPLGLKQSVIFVLPTHYNNSCAACLKELHASVGADRITTYSLCGFSRGGISLYKYLRLADWKILGLIDPSAPTMGGFAETVLDGDKNKVRCVYRMANWAKADYFPKIDSFHKHLVKLDVKMVDNTNTAHANMPNHFFETYRGDFV